MRTRDLILLFIFISLYSFTNAQNLVQKIRGTIIDKDSKSPITGVAVIITIDGKQISSISDENGHFKIENVPIGRQKIVAILLGYKTVVLQNIEINTGKETVLEIEMEQQVQQIESAVVVANKNKSIGQNSMAAISSRQFSIEETGRYAGSRNDVSRMAANYAGVSNANDSRNDIVIRGNSPLGLLWRFEGIDIPSPNHFSGVGSNGGPISVLNYNVLSNSDFLTGAFPSEFGNATSGVFDIKMRNGNNQRHENTFQIGILGTEFMSEGPFNKDYNGSYMANYRFSTTGVLTKMGIKFGYSGQANYQDASFKVSLPTKNAGNFELFGMGGISSYKVNWQDQEKNFNESYTENRNSTYNTSVGAAGVSHTYLVNSKSFIKTIIGISGRTEDGVVDSVNLTPDHNITPYYRSNNIEYKISAHSFYKMKIGLRNTLKLGGIMSNIHMNINEKLYQSQIMSLDQLRAFDDNTILYQAYTQWQLKPTDNITFNTGLHFQALVLNTTKVIEPRFSIKWQFTDNQSLNLGYGLHSQMQTLPLYFVATETPNGIVNTNKNLDFSKSHHFILGYNNQIAENTNLKIETYYQALFNIPVAQTASSFSAINEGVSYIISYEDSLVNKGTGRNYGIEATLEHFFNKGYYYLVTLSLFDSKYKGRDGILRNTAYNGRYVINALVGKEFQLSFNKKLLIDLKASFAGGRRYTPIDSVASRIFNKPIRNESKAYSEQMKDYTRIDFKITYRVNTNKYTHEFFLNIDNILNNKNVFNQSYSQKTKKQVYVYQLGILPTFQYKIYF